MDDKVKRTLRAIDSLSAAQRDELRKKLKGYEETGRLDEQVRKDAGLVMGPIGGCPYCGK